MRHYLVKFGYYSECRFDNPVALSAFVCRVADSLVVDEGSHRQSIEGSHRQPIEVVIVEDPVEDPIEESEPIESDVEEVSDDQNGV